MIKNGEIYQIDRYKYLITSDKGQKYVGCLISNDDKWKTLPNLSYYIPEYGYACCEYIKILNTDDLINKVGKVDDNTLSEIKLRIIQIMQGEITL